MITCRYTTYKLDCEDSSNVFQSTLPFCDLKTKIIEGDDEGDDDIAY